MKPDHFGAVESKTQPTDSSNPTVDNDVLEHAYGNMISVAKKKAIILEICIYVALCCSRNKETIN